MARWARPVCVAAAVVAAAWIPGCLVYRETTMLLPDGSGRMALSVGLADAGTGPPGLVTGGARGWIDRLASHSQGVAAFTGVTEKGNSTECVIWFDDVNLLSLFNPAGKESPPYRLAWRKEGDGFALEARGMAIQGLAAKFKDDIDKRAGLPPEQRAMVDKLSESMLKLFDGLDMRVEFRLPGAVRSTKGFTGGPSRAVTAQLTAADLRDAAKLGEIAKNTTFTATCGPSVLTPQEIDTFRKELAAAKQAWNSDPASKVVVARIADDAFRAKGPLKLLGVSGPNRLILTQRTDSEERQLTLQDRSGKELLGMDLHRDARAAWATSNGTRVIACSAAPPWLITFDAVGDRQPWEREPTGDAHKFAGWNVTVLSDELVALTATGERIEILNAATGVTVRTLPDEFDIREWVPVPGRLEIAISEPAGVSVVDAVGGKILWTRTLGNADRALDAGTTGGPILVRTKRSKEADTLDALDPATGKTLWTHSGHIESVAVSPAGRYAVVRERDFDSLLDLGSGSLLGRLRVDPPQSVARFAFGADDRTLLLETRGKTLAAGGDLIEAKLDLPAPPK